MESRDVVLVLGDVVLAMGDVVLAVGNFVLALSDAVLVLGVGRAIGVGVCAEVVGVRVMVVGVRTDVIGVRVRSVGARVAITGLRADSCGVLRLPVLVRRLVLRVASCGVRLRVLLVVCKPLPLLPPAFLARPGGMQPFEPGVQPQPVFLPWLHPNGVPPFCFQPALPWLKPAGMPLRLATLM